eukprot:Gregarina_sp_Pseudo_9__1884@NODE_2291_length_1056_cov_165_408063_g2109_i0_p1_GENE_NODE_2291_length_1056_cov_165_408063_g2109_i0NODE_2291_length_1056_cov_165_408063_g2109_i0_p1_ORF_typecomplete_len277_score38_05dCMP_cyt_deam_1/PF00383_23/4_9e23MafB19deam/PF14437_6/8_7e14Bd3614deam/PF14439_6/1_3e03Bd3614deam/PF14439_6/0_022SNAD4/PF18750_1/0_069APOBEC4_like/PF18774_1/5_5e03APOBEC4_like/PF18774_1/0_19_NODE_2291_length_1056_cov_165_408063_g2109_i0152982
MTKMSTNVILLVLCPKEDQWEILSSVVVKANNCRVIEWDEFCLKQFSELLVGNQGTRFVCRVQTADLEFIETTCLKRPACLLIEVVDKEAPTHKCVAFQLVFDGRLNERVAALLEQAHQLIRPDWDTYFLHLAMLVSTRANCRKRRVGAVIVKSRRIVSTGYNGTASGTMNCLDGGCRRCQDFQIKEGEKLDTCVCLHAESNAIIEQGRDRVCGGTLFVTCTPCIDCAKTIIQAGIKRVVYINDYSDSKTSVELLANAGVTVNRVSIKSSPVTLDD